MTCTNQSIDMQPDWILPPPTARLTVAQQLELNELMTGIDRCRCDLVTAQQKLKELSPYLPVAAAALGTSVSFIDGARSICQVELTNLSEPGAIRVVE